jgi:polyphosphate kinase
VYYFLNDGREQVLLSSADWMDRNFFRRVEVCFPLSRKSHVSCVKDDLKLYLDDTAGAWSLQPDGRYERVQPEAGEAPVSAQTTLLVRNGALL